VCHGNWFWDGWATCVKNAGRRRSDFVGMDFQPGQTAQQSTPAPDSATGLPWYCRAEDCGQPWNGKKCRGPCSRMGSPRLGHGYHADGPSPVDDQLFASNVNLVRRLVRRRAWHPRGTTCQWKAQTDQASPFMGNQPIHGVPDCADCVNPGQVTDWYTPEDLGTGQLKCGKWDPKLDGWADGEVCGLGTTCKFCKNKASHWFRHGITACGSEPGDWHDGKPCLLGTTCNSCNNPAKYWDSLVSYACGNELCWSPGAVCGIGTTCKHCCRGYHWYSICK